MKYLEKGLLKSFNSKLMLPSWFIASLNLLAIKQRSFYEKCIIRFSYNVFWIGSC